jgi:hypothetical protein
MRQLVSVVTGESVSYFVSDDDDTVTQVAQVINPGFGVGEVVELGSSLVDVLRLNGKRKRVSELPTPAREIEPAPKPVEPAPKRARRNIMPSRGEVAERKTATVEYVRAHPDCDSNAIADLLDVPPHVAASVLARLVAAGELRRSEALSSRNKLKYEYRVVEQASS